mmetsp:Transcript_94900/g.192994  ORF Transcript_94900/g.192994 Transcript_94900/m.192994 type:complete len:168 (-) Transcript_94900:149-652(-)
MWTPQPIYPTSDGWCPPAWPTNEEQIKEEEAWAEWPRRNLIKRFTLIKASQAEALFDVDFMQQYKYSLQVYPLREDTQLSGFGDQRGYVCGVYYESRDEQTVLRAWGGLDVDLTAVEREVVDPDSPIASEQGLMYSKEQCINFNVNEWEVVKDGEEPKTYEDGPMWP